MKIAAIGRTQLLYRSMLEMRGSIAAVVTSKAAPEYTVKEDDFERLAGDWKIPFVLTNTLDDPKVSEAVMGCDLAISINWTSVIQERHIKMFRLGIINVHCGDLPAYCGNACPNWAMLKGEKEIVVSAHFMEGGRLDCGRVLNQMRRPLEKTTFIADIYKWLEDETPRLLSETVRILEQDEGHSLKYAYSSSKEAFRCWPRMPGDGFVDWNMSAVDVDRLVKASGRPFSGAYCYQKINGRIRKLIIFESRVESEETNDLYVPGQVMENNPSSGESRVGCGRGIVVLRLCRYSDEDADFRPGKRWRSIRMRLGARIEDFLWETGIEVESD